MPNDELDAIIERVVELTDRLQATPGARRRANAGRESDSTDATMSEELRAARRLLEESRAILESLHVR